MTRRVLAVVGVLAILLLAYLLPLLPPVRAWLLGFAQDAAARAGYDVAFQGSAGNLWHDLRLTGVTVTGPGVDAEVDRLALGYALPALVTGTLPLDLELSGVRGDVRVDDLTAALAPDAPPAAEPGGGPRVTPALRRAVVSGVDLTVDGTPLNLGHLRVEDLAVRQQGARLEFSGALASGDAGAEVQGEGTLSPLALDADVRADVALGRPFFDGLEGGTLSGTVRVDEAGATGDLELAGGAVTLVGLELQGVSGPVRLRGRSLTTDLTGRALGGPLSGTASVDLEAQRWQADVTGDAALAEAALWLAEGRVPLGAEALRDLLGLSGRADVSLTAGGWQDVSLSGTATGSGELRGERLTDLQVDFGFETDVGTRAEASGALGGAPFSFALTPAGGGFRVQADGAALPLADGVTGGVQLDLTSGEGGFTGAAALSLEGEAFGRTPELELRAQAQEGAWRVRASGTDGQGAQLSGEASLQGGAVTGDLSVGALELPGLEGPVNARLRADGPLGALPLSLELSGPDGVRPSAGGVTLGGDLSGSATATLAGSTLEALSGEFGPLTLGGTLDLGARSGDLSYTLGLTPLEGRAAGRAGVQGGTVTLTDGALTATGTLRSEGLGGAGVTLPDLTAPFSLAGTAPGDWSATLQDPAQGVDLALEAGTLRGTLDGTPVGALGETFAVSGDATAALDALTDTLALDLQAAAPSTQLSVTGDAARLGLELRSEAGATLAGRTLGAPLTLSGEGSLRAGRAALSGALGEVRLELQGRRDEAGTFEADATVTDGENTLRTRLGGEGASPGDWTTDGTLPLEGLGEALGLPLTGRVRTDLARRGGVFTGGATLAGDAFGLPVTGSAQGAGDAVAISAETEALGQTLTLTGRAVPAAGDPAARGAETAVDATLTLGELGAGTLRGPLGELAVSGSGRLPEVARAGLTVPPLPWTAEGSLDEGLELRLGASTLSAQRDDTGTWALQGEVTQEAQWAGRPVTLQADLSGEGTRYEGAGTLSVAGETLPVRFQGEGGAVQGGVQLQNLDLAALSPATGTASGTVRFSTPGAAGRPLYEANVSATGAAAGAPFDLTLLADPEAGLRASGEVAGARVTLRGPLPPGSVGPFTLTAADERAPLDLDATLNVGEALRLTATGALRGEALALTAVYDPAREGESGSLNASLGNATLSGTLTTGTAGGEARRVQASLEAPTGLPAVLPALGDPDRAPLSADVRLVQAPGRLQLEGLNAALGPNTLELVGTVALGEDAGGDEPRADLAGRLSVPAAGAPIALLLRPLETGHLATLTQDELELRAVLAPGVTPQRVRLEGTLGRTVGGARLDLTSDLVWQAGRGWGGAATLDAARPGEALEDRPAEARARLTLTGQETLAVGGEVYLRGARAGALAATLAPEPWRDRTLSGRLELSAPLHDLMPAWVGEPLTLAAPLELGGTLDRPRLGGPVSLTGALTASGSLAAGLEGGRLELLGPGLSAVASVTGAGYSATLSADTLDLAGVLPPLGAPTLSGGLRAAGRFGEPLTAQLTDLRLLSGEGRLTGRARWEGGLAAALELDASLGDLNPALQGRLTGPLTVAEDGALEVALRLVDAGPEGGAWTLGGTLAGGGTLADPTLRVDLAGAGEASGRVVVTAAPGRGTFGVTSDLSLGALETDLSVTRAPRLEARGTARFGAFGVALQEDAGRLRLVGRDRLSDWTAALEPATTAFTLRGPLAALTPQVSGRLELAGTLSNAEASGALLGVQAPGLELGDVAVSVSGTLVRLTGAPLEADVTLSGGLPWRLARLELPLPGGLVVRGTGSGGRQAGTVDGVLARAADEDGLALPLSAFYGPDGFGLRARGGVPGGALTALAHFDGAAWGGGVRLVGGPVALESALSGPLGAPRLAGTAAPPDEGAGPFTLRGTFDLSPDAATFGATLDAALLEEPLLLSGGGWPLRLWAGTQAGLETGDALQLTLLGGRLQPQGTLALGVGPTEVSLSAAEAGLDLTLRAPAAPGLALTSTLPRDVSAWGNLAQGVRFRGAERTEGRVTLLPAARAAEADALRWAAPAGALDLSGRVALGSGGAAGTLQGRWDGAEGAPLPWLEALELPLTVNFEGDALTLTTEGPAGTARLGADLEGRLLTVVSDLDLGGGRLVADARYTPLTGPDGTVRVTALPLAQVEDEAVRLSSDLTLNASGASGGGTLTFAGGRLDASGELGWARALPEGVVTPFFPDAGDALDATLRLERFQLSAVPWLARRLPYLEAPVSGVAQLRPNQVVGQLLAPELRVGETALPAEAEFNGTFARLEARASVGGSRLNAVYDARSEAGGVVSGLLTLEGFPLGALAEAVLGESQVVASATGAARFEVPLRNPAASYVRVASERLTVQRARGVRQALPGPGAPLGGGAAEGTASSGAANAPRGAATRGPVTEGDIALRFEDGALFVERAEFRGDGFWRAQGQLTPQNLDFTLEAQDADFTPLLSLFPPLAAFDVGASGSLDLRAAGSPSAPDITLSSPALALSVAGSSYRAVNTEASLSGGAFGLSAELIGVSPLQGNLALQGSGQVSLSPFVASGVALRFAGGATIPTVGTVTDIAGRIFPQAGLRDWQLEARGVLGDTFTVTGTLAPLDLTLLGGGLNVRAERLFLASSDTDLNLNLSAQEGEFVVTGSAFAREAQLSLAARQGGAQETPSSPPEAPEDEPAPPSEPAPPLPEGLQADDSVENGLAETGGRGASALLSGTLGDGGVPRSSLSTATLNGTANGTGSAVAAPSPPSTPSADEVPTASPATTDPAANGVGTTPEAPTDDATGTEVIATEPGPRTPNPVLQRIRFDDLTVRAPREVVFQEAIGSAELGVDVTVSGTAAAPLLSGEARTLRGTVRFSGQDFVLTQGVALFDPSQGAFPTLTLEARASFEKGRALGVQAGRAEIVAPPGPTFDAFLSVTGGFEENAAGRAVLELEPTLTSNAQLQEGTAAPRALSETELVSLLTLGRLQLGAPLTGAGGVAGSVAESALDTAVDLLVLSELQSALGEAIGVDLFEIRTSSLSTLLDGQLSDPFGVSVRVGGYLGDNLFASLQVGSFDDPTQTYALSNEFSLRYVLDPLELNLSGGVNLLSRETLTAVTDFNLALAYNLSPLVSVDAALETSTQGQGTRVGFGVSFTW